MTPKSFDATDDSAGVSRSDRRTALALIIAIPVWIYDLRRRRAYEPIADCARCGAGAR
ncbi:hypothetical protein BURKHO8Y_370022 [Burkholderia sp. 8Y]|nr:hypothetical protein BURKHO8Y_370022 [Burkholderia sp. 8Y]